MATKTESPIATGVNTGASGPQTQRPTTQGQASPSQQNLTKSQRSEVSRPDATPSYFPSPAEFFDNPFAAMRRMHEDMDRMFAQALGAGSQSRGSLASWSPAIEVKQQGNNLVVCAELPGLKPEEVQVEVNQDALVIQGERRQEQTSEEGPVHRTERRYGQFYRAIPLPEGANAGQAKASFHDGVLEVTIPLPEQQSTRRQIPINGGNGSNSPNSEAGQSNKGSTARS